MKIAIGLVLFAGFCLAEDTVGFHPVETNVPGAEYPRVDGASRVELRVKAPDATKVNFWSGPKLRPGETIGRIMDGYDTASRSRTALLQNLRARTKV
jgi:hypothetical protein